MVNLRATFWTAACEQPYTPVIAGDALTWNLFTSRTSRDVETCRDGDEGRNHPTQHHQSGVFSANAGIKNGCCDKSTNCKWKAEQNDQRGFASPSAKLFDDFFRCHVGFLHHFPVSASLTKDQTVTGKFHGAQFAEKAHA